MTTRPTGNMAACPAAIVCTVVAWLVAAVVPYSNFHVPAAPPVEMVPFSVARVVPTPVAGEVVAPTPAAGEVVPVAGEVVPVAGEVVAEPGVAASTVTVAVGEDEPVKLVSPP